jgi:hypothetical protein
VFPIGVDVDAVQREAVESQGTEASKRMVAGLLGRKLMIGVDRLGILPSGKLSADTCHNRQFSMACRWCGERHSV